MSNGYFTVAFTPGVQAAQSRYGSQKAYARYQAQTRLSATGDPLTPAETEFIAERDGFYLGTVGETGWPYVQFRGGPQGFLRVLDDHTLGWADFRGNRQYISIGNVAGNDRVALFLMDYANQLRLKIFGHVQVVDVQDRPELAVKLTAPGYRAKVERAVTVRVEAYDWNCPQHITPRYTAAELQATLAPVRDRLAELEHENKLLRTRLQAIDAQALA